MITIKSAAVANNTAVLIIWTCSEQIPGCLGFSLRRVSADGTKETLPSWLPFEGEGKDGWTSRTTDEWPIQGFKWKDFGATEGKSYHYEIVPMKGEPGKLVADEELAVTTNEVTVGTDFGYIQACFNRGILSTQALAKKLPKLEDGSPDPQAVIDAINTPGSEIRKMLAGTLPAFLKKTFEEARATGGHVYSALYELSDPELVEYLLANPDLFSMILANAGADDETNKDAREKLHKLGADVTDRMLPKSMIGHNKSNVLVSAEGTPLKVQSGSVNWTQTGMCTQSNNALIVASEELARYYIEYWKLLKEDKEQDAGFRKANGTKKKEVKLPDGTRVTVWFSPNTELTKKPRSKPPVPADMGEVFDAMSAAKDGIYFLAFYPGFPSIISKVNGLKYARKELFVRGAVSSPQALPRKFEPKALIEPGDPVEGITTTGDSGESIVSGIFSGIVPGMDRQVSPVRLFSHDYRTPVIVAADSIESEIWRWQKELLKLPDAHAIIHDKIVVIDPFGDEPVVIVGSHNLGFKASYQNDENLLIIRGNHRLAAAYLVHILDVYDHYRFRSLVNSGKGNFSGHLKSTEDWQKRFFNQGYLSSKSRRELEYFLSGRQYIEQVAA